MAYNQFHDQLLLSSGTDSLVNLHSIVSVSSTPTKPMSEFDGDDDDDGASDSDGSDYKKDKLSFHPC